MAENLNGLGDVARCQDDYVAAGTYYAEGLALARELGSKGTTACLLHNLGYVPLHRGDPRRAVALFGESLALCRDRGDEPGMAECVAGFAAVAGVDGRLKQAAQLLGAAEAALEARRGAGESVQSG